MTIKDIKPQYEKDFYAWITHNVKLLREGRLTEIDAENIAEEIESMGRSEKRELINRLAILMSHLLKWQYQPERRSNSWLFTIKEQRKQLIELLEESPSLKNYVQSKLHNAYEHAVLVAARQMGKVKEDFPRHSLISFEKCLDENHFPD